MKMLVNYLSTDIDGFGVISDLCYRWREKGIREVADVVDELMHEGVLIGTKPRKGLHMFGNMYNPNNGNFGDVWITAKVVDIMTDVDGTTRVETSSGSEYYLLKPFAFSKALREQVSDPEKPEPSVDEVFKDPLRFLESLSDD